MIRNIQLNQEKLIWKSWGLTNFAELLKEVTYNVDEREPMDVQCLDIQMAFYISLLQKIKANDVWEEHWHVSGLSSWQESDQRHNVSYCAW